MLRSAARQASSGEIHIYSGADLTVDGNLSVGVNGLGNVYDSGTLTIGDAGSILLGQNSITADWLSTLVLLGPTAVLVTAAPLVVGIDGQAAFGLEDGASYTTIGDLVLGENAGGYGDVFVYDSTLNISGDLVDGQAGTGSFSVGDPFNDGPTHVTVAGNVIFGQSENSGGGIEIYNDGTLEVDGTLGLGIALYTSGTVTLSGPNAVLDVAGSITLADAGAAFFSLLQGASLNIAGDQTLAAQITSEAFLDLENGSNLSISGGLYLGQSGSATVTVYTGSTLESGGAILGELVDSTGKVTIDDFNLDRRRRPYRWRRRHRQPYHQRWWEGDFAKRQHRHRHRQ